MASEVTGKREGIVGEKREVSLSDTDLCVAEIREGGKVCHVIKVSVGEDDCIDLIFIGGDLGHRLGGIDENVSADIGVCTPADLSEPADRFTHTV